MRVLPSLPQKTTNNVESRARLAGRGAQRGARTRAPARRDGSLSSGSGPAGTRLEPKRTLSVFSDSLEKEIYGVLHL